VVAASIVRAPLCFILSFINIFKNDSPYVKKYAPRPKMFQIKFIELNEIKILLCPIFCTRKSNFHLRSDTCIAIHFFCSKLTSRPMRQDIQSKQLILKICVLVRSTHLHCLKPSFVAKWLALMLYFREFPGANLCPGIGYPV
jgi:hypothetical protein